MQINIAAVMVPRIQSGSPGVSKTRVTVGQPNLIPYASLYEMESTAVDASSLYQHAQVRQAMIEF